MRLPKAPTLRPSVLLRACVCGAIALPLYIGASWFNSHQASKVQKQEAWNLAKQVSVQATALTYEAREKGQADPVDWAAKNLTQGEEPRVVQVFKAQIPSRKGTEVVGSWDARGSVLDTIKVILPHEGVGVRVRVALTPRGWFGLPKGWMSDLAGLAIFLSIFWLCWLGFTYWYFKQRVSRIEVSVLPEPPASSNGSDFGGYFEDSKAQVNELGGHLRTFLVGLKNILGTASGSYSKVQTSSKGLDEGLEGLRKTLKELQTHHDSLGGLSASLGQEAEGSESLKGALEGLDEVQKAIHSQIEAVKGDLDRITKARTGMGELGDDLEKIFKLKDELVEPMRQTTQVLSTHAAQVQKMEQEVSHGAQ